MTYSGLTSMLAGMSEKQEKKVVSGKSDRKKTAVKEKSPVKTRAAGSGGRKKTRKTSRKKHKTGRLIAALGILCFLLLGFNLFLVLKLIPNLKNAAENTQLPMSMTKNAIPQTDEITAVRKEDASSLSAKPEPQNVPAKQSEQKMSEQHQPELLKRASETKSHAQTKDNSRLAAAPIKSGKETKRGQRNADKVPALKPQQKKRQTMPTIKGNKNGSISKKTTSVQSEKSSAAPVPKEKTSSAVHKTVQVPPLAKPEQPRKKVPHAGTLMFVFDDAGHSLTHLDYFLRLPFPCTIAVLPQLRYSIESARRIRKAGKQVILHQPMQSIDPRIDPGPGAVKPGLSAEQIKSIVRKNLEEIWPVAGMNNHEGSLITEDAAAIKAVLEVVAEKKIFFLDSRTTAKSVVPKVAKEQNMVVWERAVFIDNERDRRAMETQIKRGMAIARRTGSAILIGHVVTTELAELLTDMYPALVEEGFSLSAIASTAQKGNKR